MSHIRLIAGLTVPVVGRFHQHGQRHVSARLWEAVGQDKRSFDVLRRRASTYLQNAAPNLWRAAGCRRTFAEAACSSGFPQWSRSICHLRE
ncbi:MAG: hypothetical protein WDA27_03415 [Actinomycetota bacterium]